jgi:hypothetical protein
MICQVCQKNIQVHDAAFTLTDVHRICYFVTLRKLKQEYEEIQLQTHQKNLVNNHIYTKNEAFRLHPIPLLFQI